MNRAAVVSSVILGFILAATAGLAQAEAREPVATATGRSVVSEMRGEELPFPVGWLPEAEIAAFSHEISGPVETGALPKPEAPAFELKGTELPFPVGWVPE